MRIAPLVRRLDRLFLPSEVRARYCPETEDQRLELRRALERDYFSSSPYGPGYLDGPDGRLDMWMHLAGRLDAARTLLVPWLNAVRALRGATMLEIGSGTGAVTLALAEQGAHVTCLDVVEKHMRVARRRCEMHALATELVCANAADLAAVLRGRRFDLVVFCASLEHMTLDERLRSIAGAFDLLADGGLCVVFETPNRLWPFDDHTAMEPFFHWLPTEIAVRVGARSRRPLFAEWCAANAEDRTGLARWGRGASYHEFELALGPEGFEVVSTLDEYWEGSHLRRLGRLWSKACRVLERMESERATRPTAAGANGVGPALAAWRSKTRRCAVDARACRRMLRSLASPHVHPGFLGQWLNLALRPVPRT